jgi:tRNA-intron endonuclease
MTGELVDDSVIIRDQKEGSQIYNKGNYGYPMSRGGLELDLMEACCLLESGRLEVLCKGKAMSFDELFDYSSTVYSDFDIQYLVYRDLRARGFIVKAESGTFDLSVFPRGMQMSNSRPLYMVRAVSERTAFDISTFANEVHETESKEKQLLYGVVDEEGDLTYYIMSRRDPQGQVSAAVDGVHADGRLIRDRVFVFEPEQSKALHASGFYGKMMDSVLQLSLIESCYLIGKGALTVTDADGKTLGSDDLVVFGRGSQDEFDLRLAAFSDARARGLVVKTGFKYGTHFRAYEESPDACHARYLIHAVDAGNRTMWPEISRAVRLAGGVKKEFLFSRVGKGGVEYLEFKWFRP